MSRATPPPPAPARLSVHRFADRRLAGAVLGALERMERDDAPQVLDALYVAIDPATGELEAVDLGVGRADGTLAGLLDFRLDPAARRDLTRRTLAPRPGAVSAVIVQELARALGPGGALLAVLVAGATAGPLEEAVHRSGGRLVVAERVDAAQLADLVPQLRAAL